MKYSMVYRILGLLAGMVLLLSSARADDVLFEVHKKNSDTVFQVTRSVADKLTAHEFKAYLPGGEGKVQTAKGPLLRDVLAAAGIEGGERIWVKALDGYELDIPYTDATEFDLITATSVDGKVLTVRDRGPAWIVYPNIDKPQLNDALYEARSVWQLKELTIE